MNDTELAQLIDNEEPDPALGTPMERLVEWLANHSPEWGWVENLYSRWLDHICRSCGEDRLSHGGFMGRCAVPRGH